MTYSFNEGSSQCPTYLFQHPDQDQIPFVDERIYCGLDGTPLSGPAFRRAIIALESVVKDSAWAL